MRSLRWLLWLWPVVLLALAPACPAAAAVKNPVTWEVRLEPADVRAGESAQLIATAKIEAPWHLYSLTKRDGPGPKPTSFQIDAGQPLKITGDAVQPAPLKEIDKGFKIEVEYYEGAVSFGVPVQVAAGKTGQQTATLTINFMTCKEGVCLPPLPRRVPVSFEVAAGPARPERVAAVTAVPQQPAEYHGPSGPTAGPTGGTGGQPDTIAGQIADAKSKGLLAFLGLSIAMGFLALLTPCVFPMIPVTVSFFSKQSEGSTRANIAGPVAYCLGIILTFTLLGLLVTLAFGASGLQALATNPWVNTALALLFIVLAVNLFGGFEILLPSWMVDRAQQGSGMGGLVGPMLMGLTFTLTSFTCTVPFVGTLLATTAKGDVFWPVLGMLGFSSAFALPFFLLALFPQWLARLPKSGGWLVTVKAYMGFLELAAALKFLSNADLAWSWGVLTRPAFLAVWFAIAVAAGCYMIGWVGFTHAHGAGKPGPLRRGIGVLTLAGSVGCLLAINGAGLGWFSGLLPPRTYPGHAAAVGEELVKWEQDYDRARELARQQGKLLFLNFTGIYCTNCRTVEDGIFRQPEVAAELNQFVPVELYTDKADARSNRYQQIEVKQFGQNTLPLYAVVDADERKLGEYSVADPRRLTDAAAFLDFLKKTRAANTASR
jgi:thiol:disulfide interchange protein